ncbi:response regulator [Calothrix rhizosoleniae]|uniref:response regulator n=1 Tax=Calothrix rhizosoleniae TaxID=888997 RepID=UPI000B498FB0|nr:response regulator transcription factor [Calothrix rhizosoleniae]
MLPCHTSAIRVLLVDDHELTRLTLKLAFSNQANIQIVGLATNGKEAIDIAKQSHPDVVILDLQMPVMDGWSASCQIKAIAPTTQIIAYSSVEDSKFQAAKAMGKWDAFCQKDIPTTELIALAKKLGKKSVNGFSCKTN